MNGRLSSPLSALKPHYDVAVVGSGYGAGVAAARLASAGRSVCVLERGREIAVGEFPARLTDMQRETQVSSSAGRIGDRAGLFDVRLGRDVHVAMGCGLGGTSLINANVCLEADPRVFEDPCWPAPVLRDGLLAEGLTRARAMLRPKPYPGLRKLLKLEQLGASAKALGGGAYPAAAAHRLRARHQRRRRGAARVRAVRRLLRRLQRRRQDHHGADLFAGRGTGRRRNLHARRGALGDEAEGRQVAHQHRHAPRKRLGDPHGRSRQTSSCWARARWARPKSCSDPETEGLALSEHLGARFTTNGDALANAYNNDRPVNSVGVGYPAKAHTEPVGPAVAGLVDLRRTEKLEDGLALVEASIPSGAAALLPALFAVGGPLIGRDTDFSARR